MTYLSSIGAIVFLMIATMESTMANEIKVKVQGVDVKRGGNLIVMLFSPTGFPKKHQDAIHSTTVKANQTEMLFSFSTQLQEIAIKVLHDENGDGKVTKNWTGILPVEGLGFSNEQKIGLTGPPNYQKSKVTIKDPISQFSITLRYP